MPGARLSPDLAVATSMLMWVRFCWYLKNMRLGWAKFVLMFEDIIWDLRYYLFYFLVVLICVKIKRRTPSTRCTSVCNAPHRSY